MKNIKIIVLLIIICFFCCSCSKKQENNNTVEDNTIKEIHREIDDEQKSMELYSGRNGTADTIEGKTIIISIYANDEIVTWNNDLESDKNKIDDTLNNLKLATDYLTKEVSKYNKTAAFTYDWKKYSDLKYEATFKDNIVDNYNDKYITQKEWIIDNIDILKLKQKYAADNVIFMYFFNTDNTNTAITSTYNLDLDIVNVFPENNRYIVPPATYAHELLHTFGAPDLYFENITINQDYVDYLLEIDSDDIMFKVTDTSLIIDEFTDLDAYYVGLIDSHPDIEKWNLGISEHLY